MALEEMFDQFLIDDEEEFEIIDHLKDNSYHEIKQILLQCIPDGVLQPLVDRYHLYFYSNPTEQDDVRHNDDINHCMLDHAKDSIGFDNNKTKLTPNNHIIVTIIVVTKHISHRNRKTSVSIRTGRRSCLILVSPVNRTSSRTTKLPVVPVTWHRKCSSVIVWQRTSRMRTRTGWSCSRSARCYNRIRRNKNFPLLDGTITKKKSTIVTVV